MHKDGLQRLKEREDCFLRINFKEEEGRTLRQLEGERRKEMLDYNMKTFGKVSIGVHGKELPKYAECQDQQTKEWWKLKRGYNDRPNYQSQKILRQTQKHWAKNDEMLLADVKDEPAP